MKTTTFLLLLSLIAARSTAQRQAADSLRGVNDFLYAIRLSIPASQNEAPNKMQRLDSLLRRGDAVGRVMARQLALVLPDNKAAQQESGQMLTWILQSAALLRSDLKQLPLKSSGVQGEVKYLHQHIPPLVDRLNRYSQQAMTQYNTQTH